MSDYKEGLLKAVEQIIDYVQNQIQSVKSENPKPNSEKQIHNGGKLSAYNKVLIKLQDKKEKITSKVK